jgi:exosortase
VLVVLITLIPYNIGYAAQPVSMFRDLWLLWTGYEDWIHGMFVPFISGFFVWLKREELAALPVKGENWALVPILFAFFLYWAGFRTDVRYIGHIGIQLLVGALVVWYFGWPIFKRVLFPWAFLIFTWPFLFLDNMVAFPLRMVMSEISFRFLDLVGLDVMKVGTAIVSAPDFARGLEQGARFAVDIADPCSGIRSLFALMMISCVYGHFTLQTPLQKWILFLLAVPLAVAGNFIRIMLLTFGTLLFGSEFAIGTIDDPSTFHMMAGFAVFFVALGGMILATHFLKKMPERVAVLIGRGSLPQMA